MGAEPRHIVPWDAAYKNTQVLRGAKGRVRFVMGASGHIAGVINPPAANKYQFWTNDNIHAGSVAEWLKGAQEHKGSWWPDWAAWMADKSGPKVPAPLPGSGKLAIIEDAPGSYVKVRASE